MKLPQAISLLFSISAIGSLGCDPMLRVQQSVVLSVVDDSKRPVVNATVGLKHVFDQPHASPGSQSEALSNAHAKRAWSERPWFSGKSDDAGTVVINVEAVDIGATEPGRPAPAIAGKGNSQFLVRVHNTESNDRTVRTEQLRIILEPGDVVQGEVHRIRVDAIRDPVYVPFD